MRTLFLISDLTATDQPYCGSGMVFSTRHQRHKLFSCTTAERRWGLLENSSLFKQLKELTPSPKVTI